MAAGWSAKQSGPRRLIRSVPFVVALRPRVALPLLSAFSPQRGRPPIARGGSPWNQGPSMPNRAPKGRQESVLSPPLGAFGIYSHRRNPGAPGRAVTGALCGYRRTAPSGPDDKRPLAFTPSVSCPCRSASQPPAPPGGMPPPRPSACHTPGSNPLRSASPSSAPCN